MKIKMIRCGLSCGLVILLISLSNTSVIGMGGLRGDVLDQQQTESNGFSPLATGCYYAQSFKPTYNTLTRVELLMCKYGSITGDIHVQLCRSVEPFDAVRSDLSFIPDNHGFVPQYPERDWVEWDFDDLPVIPGEVYYIVAYGYGSSSAAYYWWYSDSNPYPRGTFWNTDDKYGRWYDVSYMDQAFLTFGETEAYAPEISLTPSSHGFGTVEEGSESSWYAFTLRNIGNGMAFGSVGLGGDDPGQFEIDEADAGSFQLLADETKSIRVRFCPGSEGNYTAVLEATGENCNSESSSLSGTGEDEEGSGVGSHHLSGPLTRSYDHRCIDIRAPSAPVITSSSHPDEARWYDDNTPSFE